VVPRQLPLATRHFAGRADALEVLAGLAAETGGTSRAVVISVIEGTAGVGKTTLAVHFAHRVADRFPDGQLYVNLRGFDPAASPMPAGEATQIFLEALGVRPARIPAGLESRAALYRSLLAGRRMLVLLDNAADADQVRPLLPGSPGCLVLVTSRSQLTDLVATEGAYSLALDLLTSTEARELLARRLGAGRLGGDHADGGQLGGGRPGSEAAAAGELIELCARLPLALAIMAARAASQPGRPLAALAADLRDAGGRLDALDAGHGAANVRAVFAASYRQLDPAAARLFRLLGLHPGPDISAPAAASLAGLPPRQARAALADLARAHLLAEPTPGRFTFHDLLRAYAAERAQADDSEAGRHAAIHRMLDHYLYTAHDATILLRPFGSPPTLPVRQAGVEPERPGDPGQALAWFGAERRVLMAAAAQALEDGFSIHAWQIPWAMGRFLDLQGYWNDWAVAEQTALAAAEQLGDRSAQAGAHLRMGFARGRLGTYQEAYAHLEQALSIYTELGDRSGQGDAENALTLILQIEGRDAEALNHAERALEMYVAIDDRFRQATALNAVGWFHSQLGDHQRALGYCEQALELLQGFGSHQAEAGTWDSLGYIHHYLGDHAESAACYRRALELFREIGDRWGQATTLDHVGDAHHAAGHQEQARAVWEESLAILDDIHHPEAGQVRAKLAGLDAGPGT
jgi:tetratricopeptide (TPR) repeat protein